MTISDSQGGSLIPPWASYAAVIMCYHCGAVRGGRPEVYGPHTCVLAVRDFHADR